MTTSQTASRVKVACPCGKTYRCRPKAVGQQLRCRACGASVTSVDVTSADVTSADVTPVDVTPVDVTPVDVTPSDVTAVDTWKLAMLLTFTGGTVLSLGLLQTLLDGMTFLRVYAVFGFLCVVLASFLPRWKFPTFITGLLPLLAFEATGLIRLWYGSSHGMHRFGFLKVLMFIAPAFLLLLFAKADVANGHSYNSTWGGGGGGGSCGGGSCGGGGGGCGGCGGGGD